MYVYADRDMAVYVSSGNDDLPSDGSAVRVYQLTKDQGKKVLVPVALGERKTADGTIVLADEISPDTSRLWDVKTHEKLDKDRFRRDLGGVEEAYAEIMRRLDEHLK